ncbi:hypothetical protein SAMN02910358_02574 [Lachnospiraceae bacterium XBB1006]|nr:hypothetical protein SAMN02910358_02574 [Lachnospiraceae bacterium XBB1006]
MKRKQFIAGAMAVVLALTPIQSVRAEGGVAVDEAHFPDADYREYVSSTFDKNKDGVLSRDEGTLSEEGYENYESTEPDDEDNASTESAGTPIQSVSVDKAHFPDDRFREYVSSTFDTNNDGVLSEDEIKEARDISCSNMGIRSLAGIEYFTEVWDLACDWNQLTELDVSKNRELDWLSCNDNQLTRLDVSGCTKLTWLDCSSNKLTKLDVSGCTQLKSLSYFGNNLTTLIGADRVDYVVEEVDDLSENHESSEPVDTSAKVVKVEKEHFPDKNFRKYVSEMCDENSDGWLSEREIKNRTTISLASNSGWDEDWMEEWITEDFGYHGIYREWWDDTRVDRKIGSLVGIEYFTELRRLVCSNNILRELDLSKNTKLEMLGCRDNKITKLDVSGCTELQKMSCYHNKLSKLDLSKNTKLRSLMCSRNKITKLNVSRCKELSFLECGRNRIGKLDLSKNTKLEDLICWWNRITELNIGGCKKLKSLECNNNRLMNLNVRGNKSLHYLSCSDNKLRKLDLSRCKELSELECQYNKLKKLDVSGCKKLKSLNCCENELTRLNVRKNRKLSGLDCSVNELTNLDLRNNKQLLVENIDCTYNPLRRIDFSKGSTRTIGTRTFEHIGGYRGKKLTFTVATKKEQQRLIKKMRAGDSAEFPTQAKVIVRKK